MICPNCHAEVNESQAFCGNCGTPLSSARAQTDPFASSSASGTTQGTQYAGGYQQPVEVVAEPIPNSAGSQQPYGTPQQPYTSTSQQSGYGTSYQQGPTPYQQGGYGQQPVSNAPFGLAIAALVCSLLGLFPIGVVLAIVALVMNSNQKKSGVVTTKQTPTFVMSVISLVVSALVALTVFVLGAAVVATMESGNYIESTPSSSLTSNPSTSSSAASTTSSSSSTTSSSAAAATGTLNSNTAASTNAYIGTWELDAIVSDSINEELTSDTLDLMKEMGVEINIIINADGTFSMSVVEESISGTWSEGSGGTLYLTSDGDTIPVTLDGDKLVLTDGNESIIFHRV